MSINFEEQAKTLVLNNFDTKRALILFLIGAFFLAIGLFLPSAKSNSGDSFLIIAGGGMAIMGFLFAGTSQSLTLEVQRGRLLYSSTYLYVLGEEQLFESAKIKEIVYRGKKVKHIKHQLGGNAEYFTENGCLELWFEDRKHEKIMDITQSDGLAEAIEKIAAAIGATHEMRIEETEEHHYTR